MKAKVRFGRLVGCALAAALLFGLTTSARADTWRIATLAPDGSSWMKVLGRGAKEIKKATDGRVQLKYYTGGVQGDEKDAVRKMQVGQLDGAALTSVGLSQIVPSIRVLELPRLFQSEEELDYVRSKMWPIFRRRFAKKGYYLGVPGEVGYIYLYSNDPIKSRSDLGKLKMWRWTDDKLVRAMFKKLGVNGVPMGVPDVLPALNTGRINACYSSPYAMVALQWYTKVKYTTSEPLSYGIAATVIKKDKWDQLSSSDEKRIEKIYRVQGRLLRRIIRKDNRKAKKTLARTIETVKTPNNLVELLDENAREVWKEQAGKIYKQSDLAKVLSYRSAYRANN